MELVKSRVQFDRDLHLYTLDGKVLSGITGMINRQLFPEKYKGDFFESEAGKRVLQKAADNGTVVHETCELIDDLGIVPNTPQGKNYVKIKKENFLVYECSEYLVSDEEHFASSIDKVYRVSDDEFILVDIKTNYSLKGVMDYVTWQLSVYAYLFERQNVGAKVVGLYVLWLKDDKCAFKPCVRKSNEMVSNLLMAEIYGTQFQAEEEAMTEKSENGAIRLYQDSEVNIHKIYESYEYWDKQRKNLLEGLTKAMKDSGVTKWEGESMSFTLKADSVRRSYDMERLKKDYPDIDFDAYLKVTNVKGSASIKITK